MNLLWIGKKIKLVGYCEDSKCVYSISYFFKELLTDMWEFYKKGLGFAVLSLFIALIWKQAASFFTIVGFLILLVIIIICLTQYAAFKNMLVIYKKSVQLKKTKVYEELKKIINTADFEKAKTAIMHAKDCTFMSIDGDEDSKGEYYVAIDFEKLGYSELNYEGQIALMRLIQKLIKKDINREFLFTYDVDYAEKYDKPYREYYKCTTFLTDEIYRRKKDAEIVERAKKAQAEEKRIKKEIKKQKKSGETW